MPGVDFVLPHWLYWLGLVVFPLVAMALTRRTRDRESRQGFSAITAGLILISVGFLGLHRIYLKNPWGILYWPFFALVLYGQSMEHQARIVFSDARDELEFVERSIVRNQQRIARSETAFARAQAQRAEVAADDPARIGGIERRMARERTRIDDANAKIHAATGELEELRTHRDTASANRSFWTTFSGTLFKIILGFLVMDLFLLPGLTRRAEAREARESGDVERRTERPALPEDRRRVGDGVAGILDRISLFSGEYVAFWTIVAVVAYYYEVVVRYIFNSPTNWVHEGMFLMFGMQYLVAGSYAMLSGSHVRVDIFYARLSLRGKAAVDLLTSVFFFIFAGVLLCTGWIFALDAMQGDAWNAWEVSFTEWAIQYWPVKIMIAVGSLLLILQGISNVLKDLRAVCTPGPHPPSDPHD